MNYAEAVAYIEETPKFTQKNMPENTEELLRRIGHPERRMKVIHVAGTNGKGSVCAFLSSILIQAGKRTGLFTSPHLVDLTERFQINGVPVDKDIFSGNFTRLIKITEEMTADGYARPTYFELLFAAGLMIFGEASVEYLVLETGLGGRLDATNLVEHPLVCVITSIGMDHMEHLGNTIEQITAEKAGIIKPGVPIVYDGRNPEADRVISARAEAMHAMSIRYEDSMVQIQGETDKKIDFLLDIGYDEKINVTVSSPAFYQVVNSSLALLALRVIDPGKEISQKTAQTGIARTQWPGRMEQVLPGVFLDGAHNEDGIRELIRTIREMQREQPVTLLFSAVAEKEYRKMIQELCGGVSFSAVVTTQIDGPRAVSAKELAELFRTWSDAPVTDEPDIGKAFERARSLRGEGLLFCAGSLYLVGALKTILRDEGV